MGGRGCMVWRMVRRGGFLLLEVIGARIVGRRVMLGPEIVRRRGLSGTDRLLAKGVAGCGRLSDTGGLPGAEEFWARKVERGRAS